MRPNASSHRVARAPPIEAVLRVPGEDPAPSRAVPAAARWCGLALGLAWGGILCGALLGLGRVPWQETLIWSGLSGFVVARSAQVATGRALAWALAPTSIELGMRDPQRMRQRLGRALKRYGYREARHRLHADQYAPHRLAWLMPPMQVAWSGPGAIVSGPRWLVRVAARLAVG